MRRRRCSSQDGRSTIHVYDCGHFDPYVAPLFDTVVLDQLTFLRTHVPTKGA